jgi:hypothetical protein
VWQAWLAQGCNALTQNFAPHIFDLKVSKVTHVKLHKKLRQSFEKKQAASLFYTHNVDGVEAKSNAAQKRIDMQENGQWVKRKTEPTTADGQPLPSAEDGWLESLPPKPEELAMVGVKTVKMSDGSVRTFRKWIIRKDVLAQKRKAVKKLKKRIAREDAEAEAAAAKRRVRLQLALMGKKLR